MTGHRTRLGLPVRARWLVREQVEAMPPDGSLHLLAFSEPVDEVTTRVFADGYGQSLAANLPGYEELDVRDVRMFGGRDAVLRRYRHVPEQGPPLTQIAAYLVDGGIGHVVTATTASSQFGAVEGDLLALLSQVELDPGSAVERPAVPAESAALRPRRDVDWSESRKAWEEAASGGTADAAQARALPDLSADELTALAQLHGATTFPFLDAGDTADATGDARAAVTRAALRSLLARGVVSTQADGSLTVQEELRDAITLILDPDLVVLLESEGEQTLRVAISADPVRRAEVTRRAGPAYTIAVGPGSELFARVAALAGNADVPARESSPAVVPALAVDRARAFLKTGDREGAARELRDHPTVAEALAQARSFNRVRTVFRTDDVVRGGEVFWSLADDAIWVFEPRDAVAGESSSVEVRPAARSDLYRELLGLLP